MHIWESLETFKGGTRDDIDRLYECINLLPPVERMLISLYLEEVGTEEMADALRTSLANVRVKVHRARKALREIWERTSDGLEWHER